jgi:hypothetical protein
MANPSNQPKQGTALASIWNRFYRLGQTVEQIWQAIRTKYKGVNKSYVEREYKRLVDKRKAANRFASLGTNAPAKSAIKSGDRSATKGLRVTVKFGHYNPKTGQRKNSSLDFDVDPNLTVGQLKQEVIRKIHQWLFDNYDERQIRNNSGRGIARDITFTGFEGI